MEREGGREEEWEGRGGEGRRSELRICTGSQRGEGERERRTGHEDDEDRGSSSSYGRIDIGMGKGRREDDAEEDR